MTGIDLSAARRLVLKYFAQLSQRPESPVEVHALEQQVGQWWSEEQGDSTRPSNGDWTDRLGSDGVPKVHEVVWDLVVQRVLTLSRFQAQFRQQAQSWKYLRLTNYGAEVVREQHWSPVDPDGYLREFAEQSSRSSELCRIYTEEALRCFRGGCYLATAVMLGAASETVMLDLFKTLAEAMKENSQMPEVSSYEIALSKTQSVFKKYKEFKKHFEHIRAILPRELNDDLDVQLDGVFTLIRYYRNSSGHPTGTLVERMAAFTSSVLFVPYCKRIEEVSKWLRDNAKRLNK
jgi:hypothetical protein